MTPVKGSVRQIDEELVEKKYEFFKRAYELRME